jgi:hypothetical protein
MWLCSVRLFETRQNRPGLSSSVLRLPRENVIDPITSYRPDSAQDKKLAATSKGGNAEGLTSNQLVPKLPWSMPHQSGAKEEK